MLYLGGDDYHPLQHTSYQEMSQEEVAQALGTTPSTVSKRLKHAREKLRTILERGQFHA
ncbi:MAG: sigma-70 family RNA polymerase sigma factor [Clostridia bacterium]|nr:sigma-70 family RNA polymerase sigma factor [Clostridia bacterium]